MKGLSFMADQNSSNQARSLLVLAVIFTILSLLGAGIAEAQGDVPKIENGFRGSMREAPILEEKAVAGIETREEAMLYSPENLFFDPDGNLHIADSGQHAIMIYSREGKFIKRLGGEGDGPGEFRMPAVSYFSWEGELVVEDPANMRRSFFSIEGEYLRSETLGPVFMGGVPVKTVNGEYARPGQGGVVMRINAGGSQEEPEEPGLLEILDSDRNVKLKIGIRKTHENLMIRGLLNRVSMAYMPTGHLVACFENANEIHIYNAKNGELERIITRRLAFNPKEPAMTTRTERSVDPRGGERIMVRAAPDTDPITDDVAVGPEGRIWVLTRLTSTEEADDKELDGDFSGLVRIEIYSPEGDLLTTIPLDYAPGMIAFDPTGDLWLVDTRESLAAYRYEVKWP